jgi:hypothetical protein
MIEKKRKRKEEEEEEEEEEQEQEQEQEQSRAEQSRAGSVLNVYNISSIFSHRFLVCICSSFIFYFFFPLFFLDAQGVLTRLKDPPFSSLLYCVWGWGLEPIVRDRDCQRAPFSRLSQHFVTIPFF